MNRADTKKMETIVEAINMAIDSMEGRRFYSGDVLDDANLLLLADGFRAEYHQAGAVLLARKQMGDIFIVEIRQNRNYYVRKEALLYSGIEEPSLIEPNQLAGELAEKLGRESASCLIRYIYRQQEKYKGELRDLHEKAARVTIMQQRISDLRRQQDKPSAREVEALSRCKELTQKLNDIKAKVGAAIA